MRSILGNFGFINKNVKDIEIEIRDDVDESVFIHLLISMNRNKAQFSLKEVMDIISKKWFYGKGRDEEIDEMYEIFDRR